MIKHFCDRCGYELTEPIMFNDKEICMDCSEIIEDFIDGKLDEFPVGAAENQPCSWDGTEWNDMKLGFPNERGIYLVTVEFSNPSGTSRMVRFAKYTGAPCWYKPGKEYGLIDETGGKVTAWAVSPEPYNEVDNS